MENSCRKKHKPSPKKWISASKRTGFRRNSAVIPANAGLFHYAANNPVRYIDPDGREAYSYKCGEKDYKFSSDCTVVEGTIRKIYNAGLSYVGGKALNFVGGIIGDFTGNCSLKCIDELLGFRKIDVTPNVNNRLKFAINIILSLSGDLNKIKGLSGSAASAVENIAKKAKFFGTASTIMDIGSSVLKRREVAIDNLIYISVGSNLSSTSHENVSTLYLYAKSRIEDLINNGDIKLDYSRTGELKSYPWDNDKINQIRDELLILKSVIEE